MKRFLLTWLFVIVLLSVAGQDKPDYISVLKDRAGKIVKTLDISDSAKYNRVNEILVNQYVSLGKIHDGADAKIKEIKSSPVTQVEKDSLIKIIESERNASLYDLHLTFLANIYGELSHEQVEAIKNGMTYNILNVTYKAQLDMIPKLKDEEKRQIYIWLLEAREHAMDASSSEKKHAWFGKYKGRINNYLSSRGYDLTKERADWSERIKQEKK
jgi:hypothetical protein